MASLSSTGQTMSQLSRSHFNWGKQYLLHPGRALVDILVPRPQGVAPSSTLSALHGVGSFPFHTETAHWRTPVDWVILRCVNPGSGNRPTLLIDGFSLNLKNTEIYQLTRSLMVVRNGARSFLAPLAKQDNESLFFRHDPGCMRPVSKIDRTALNIIENRIIRATPTEVFWETGRCLIFDNRRILHSRAASQVVDFDRRLERIYVVRKRR